MRQSTVMQTLNMPGSMRHALITIPLYVNSWHNCLDEESPRLRFCFKDKIQYLLYFVPAIIIIVCLYVCVCNHVIYISADLICTLFFIKNFFRLMFGKDSKIS